MLRNKTSKGEGQGIAQVTGAYWQFQGVGILNLYIKRILILAIAILTLPPLNHEIPGRDIEVKCHKCPG